VLPNLAVYVDLRDNVLRRADFDYDVLAHQKSRSEGAAAQDLLALGTELGVEPRKYLVHIYLGRLKKKMSRVDLTVPFAAKDEAKKLGARWDPVAKKWYAPRGEAALVDKWGPPLRTLVTSVASAENNKEEYDDEWSWCMGRLLAGRIERSLDGVLLDWNEFEGPRLPRPPPEKAPPESFFFLSSRYQ
jgi:hypothetical protein